MDETYIKMCDCEKIQEGHQPKEGDWYHVMDYWGEGKSKQRINFVLSSNVMPQGIGGDWKRVYVPILIEDIRKDTCYFGIPFEDDEPHTLIWLPTQSQLQEMVRPNWGKLPYLLTGTFNEAVNGGSCSYVGDNGKHFTSMEQLWLAFVMKERYSKQWDGNEWVAVS